jgi:hypothetical protein
MISSIGNRTLTPNMLEPGDIGEGTGGINGAGLPATNIGGFTVSRPSVGRALINLGDGYQLSINDIDRQVTLENQKTNLTTIIWGNAAISIPVAVPFPVAIAPVVPAYVTATPISAVVPKSVLPITTPISPPLPASATPTEPANVQSAALIALEQETVPAVAVPTVSMQAESLTPIMPAPPVHTEVQSLSVTEAAHTLVAAVTLKESVMSFTPAASEPLLLTPAILPIPPASTPIPTPTPTFQFWGTTSFIFGNDQKITLDTIPSADSSGAYQLDRITVTSGSNGVVINGVADEASGQLDVKAANGYDIDEETRDGLTLEECADGRGWQDEDGIALSQLVLDATAVGADYGPGSTFMSMGEIGAMLGRIISYGFMNAMMTSIAATRNTMDLTTDVRSDTEKSSDRRRVERLVVDQILAKQASEIRHLETCNIA